MSDLASLLVPPDECQAKPALKFLDKRRGAVWFCPIAHKNIGKGRKQPVCLCRQTLTDVQKLMEPSND